MKFRQLEIKYGLSSSSPKQDKQRKMAMKFPEFMMIRRTSKEDSAITTGKNKSYS